MLMSRVQREKAFWWNRGLAATWQERRPNVRQLAPRDPHGTPHGSTWEPPREPQELKGSRLACAEGISEGPHELGDHSLLRQHRGGAPPAWRSGTAGLKVHVAAAVRRGATSIYASCDPATHEVRHGGGLLIARITTASYTTPGSLHGTPPHMHHGNSMRLHRYAMAPPPWDPSTGILDVLHLDSPRPGVVAMPVKPQQTLPGGPLVGLYEALGPPT